MQVQRYINLHEDPFSKKAIIGRDRNPKVNQMKPNIPIFPRYFFPTSSVASTREQVPMAERKKPLMNLKELYIHILVERDVRTPVSDVRRQDRARRFFRPRCESAKVERRKPPERQPRKKEEEGRPLMMEGEHSSDHSEMMDAAGLETGLGPLQLTFDSASVKIAMKFCWASKNHARDDTADWMNCVRLK